VSEQKRKHSSDEGHYGFTNHKDCTIVIDAELTEQMKRTTLVHEILHAITITFGGSFKPAKNTDYLDWEHFFIGIYEEPLVMVLRDNPELVAYLLHKD
jgi:hypothetical protein